MSKLTRQNLALYTVKKLPQMRQPETLSPADLQLMQTFLPQVAGLFVNLVKETSVVGYIAVQDLTRASDFIRTRTMDAFFPLVFTAVFYLVMCHILLWVLDKIISRVLVDTRPRRIKGVV